MDCTKGFEMLMGSSLVIFDHLDQNLVLVRPVPNSVDLANLWHLLTRNTKIIQNVFKNTTLREDT